MKIYQILQEARKMNSGVLPETLWRYMSEEELSNIIGAHWDDFVDWDEEVEGADPETMKCIVTKNGDHSGQYFKSLYINPNLKGDEKKSFSGAGYEFLVAFNTSALQEYGTVAPYDACVGVNENEARLWIDKPLLSFFDPEESIKMIYWKKGINIHLAEELSDMGIPGKKLPKVIK